MALKRNGLQSRLQFTRSPGRKEMVADALMCACPAWAFFEIAKDSIAQEE